MIIVIPDPRHDHVPQKSHYDHDPSCQSRHAMSHAHIGKNKGGGCRHGIARPCHVTFPYPSTISVTGRTMMCHTLI